MQASTEHDCFGGLSGRFNTRCADARTGRKATAPTSTRALSERATNGSPATSSTHLLSGALVSNEHATVADRPVLEFRTKADGTGAIGPTHAAGSERQSDPRGRVRIRQRFRRRDVLIAPRWRVSYRSC